MASDLIWQSASGYTRQRALSWA